jgi:predicted transcriptional regulator of viral defense system
LPYLEIRAARRVLGFAILVESASEPKPVYNCESYSVVVEKQEQHDMNYTGTSANEAFLLSLVKKRNLPVFGVREIVYLSGWDRSRTYNTLASLVRKGVITRIKRDGYALTEGLGENIFRIGTELVKPSYISFWTALSYYGFTEQQVKKIQLVSTKQFGALAAGDFGLEIVTLKASRFYGYRKTEGFVIAEPEKALIDSLFRPDMCGGLDEFAKCLKNAWPGLDQKKLVEYAIRFGNKSVVSRAGHLIEGLGLETGELERLLAARSSSFVSLDPEAARIGEYDKKWRVIVNREIDREEIL